MQGVEVHLKQCPDCQKWLQQVRKVEQSIYQHEKYSQNFISLEIFNTKTQRREIVEMGWNSILLGETETGSLQKTDQNENALKFYLKFFWYGQIGIYIQNLNMPVDVAIQRGNRYIPLKKSQSKRIIEKDSVILIESSQPTLKIKLTMQKNLREKSITKKLKSLSEVSASFVAKFFKKKAVTLGILDIWEHLKEKMSIRKQGIYLMHLNTNSSYKKIARNFHVSPHYVAKLILDLRRKLL